MTLSNYNKVKLPNIKFNQTMSAMYKKVEGRIKTVLEKYPCKRFNNIYER